MLILKYGIIKLKLIPKRLTFPEGLNYKNVINYTGPVSPTAGP